jgi:hypothetical protein
MPGGGPLIPRTQRSTETQVMRVALFDRKRCSQAAALRAGVIL